jgi:DNA polymerase-3 subunit delta'
MSEAAERIEADAVAGVPHPRLAPALFGQAAAETAFLAAARADRLHHAWLIAGPRGVGKATLSWRIARWLLATTPVRPDALDVDAADPAARRIAALSEAGLFLVRRGWDEKAGRSKTVITVDEVRGLNAFFSLSRADGGRRVVIVDAADEMNPNAANALLKMLEEPPRDTVMLMVTHRPHGLLPTIRSRCRVLRCAPLESEVMGQALNGAGIDVGEDAALLGELAAGSVGEAARLAQAGGAAIYRDLVRILASMPHLDRPAALALAEAAAGRQNEARFDATLRLLDVAVSRVALRAAGRDLRPVTADEAQVAERLAPTPAAGRLWADLQARLAERGRRGRAVNLDPASLILDMVLDANETAARTVGQAP